MSINPSKRGDKTLKIKSHDGFSDGSLYLKVKFKENRKGNWNFYRENTNHSYLFNGNIKYGGNCQNNLIVYSGNEIELTDIKNSFIFSNKGDLNIFSIADFEKIKKTGLENLFGKIKYNIPLRVKQREKLQNYNPDEIKNILKNHYGIKSIFINPILSGRVKEGKYFVQDMNKKEYVFKYNGDDENTIENSYKLSFRLRDYFPEVHKRIDASSYGIKLPDGFYGLESFVKGNPINKRTLEYLGNIGKTMALIHNEFDSFLIQDQKLDFVEKGENFSESNILSLYLDLFTKNVNPLFPFIEEVINQNLSSKIRKTPKKLIHGDLNSSNVIKTSNQLVILDLETLGMDNRMKEFISPLLLDGNMTHPRYLKGSLPIIITQYNRYSNDPLTQNEISLLPYLLQSSLLKYYVVKEIRRGNKTKNGLEQIIENIERIKGDSNVY